MPIARELRHHYRTPEWREARAKALDRAQGKCEWCGKPDRARVRTAADGTGRWYDRSRGWVWPDVKAIVRLADRAYKTNPLLWWLTRQLYGAPAPKRERVITCVLGVAHLNHDSGDNDPSNLAALCQRCHLVYDGPHHRRTARLRRDRETGQLRLELEQAA